MEFEKELEGIIARELDTLGYELVKLEAYLSGRRKTLRLFIDRPDGNVTIRDCIRATKALGLVLDGLETMPGPYNLEISSPGAARPLTKPAHFGRFMGERARVDYLDEEGAKVQATGTIAVSDEDAVVLSFDGSEHRIAFEKILRANLKPEEPAGPKPEEPEGRPRRRRRARQASRR